MELDTLSQESTVGCPLELLYADDLAVIAESMNELIEKFTRWKEGMESKRLKS